MKSSAGPKQRRSAARHRHPGWRVAAPILFAAWLFGAAAMAAWAAPAHGGPQESTDPETLLGRARMLADQGKVEEAGRIARQYLSQKPDSAEGHYLLGLILFKENQLGPVVTDAYDAPPASVAKYRSEKAKESLAEYTEGAKLATPSAFDLKIVGLNYVLLGDLSGADKWLTRSLAWNPGDADGWYYLGRAKYGENRFEEAVEAFKRSLELEPQNVKARDNLGLAYAGLNRAEDAMAAFHSAIQMQEMLEKKDVGPFVNLGSLLLDQNRASDALPHLVEAVAIAPEQSKCHELLGKAYSLLNRLPEAQMELEKAVALAPQSAHLHFMLGQIYRKRGLTEKAKNEFEKMSRLRDE